MRCTSLLPLALLGVAHGFTVQSPALVVASPRSIPPAPVKPLAATTADSSKSPTTEAWIEPAVHNSNWFRGVALLGAFSAVGYASSQALAAKALASIHVLAFGTWFGTVAYTTFVAGITMFKNLPRRTFGSLQAKLFPKYFALSSAALVLQVATLRKLSVAPTSLKALVLALSMTLVNQFYLEPQSTNNMMERYRLEDTPGGTDTDEYKSLRQNFGKFHGMSSLTNLIALCAGVVHATMLAAKLAM